jgi:hypothetical protein
VFLHSATIQGLGYALKTQEEIDDWIQERKKKWPTKAVIIQKVRGSTCYLPLQASLFSQSNFCGVFPSTESSRRRKKAENPIRAFQQV